MDKRRVNHSVRPGRSTPQAVQILQITSMHLCTRGDKRLRPRIRASQPEHLMTRVNQLLNNSRTNKTRGTCYENTH